MIEEILTAHRQELIRRCNEKATARHASAAVAANLEPQGIPAFVMQLEQTLRDERDSRSRPAASPAPQSAASMEMRRGATARGEELCRHGYTIEQVVREYGDVCQSVTDLAVELQVEISADEFRSFNGCLDDAIANSVKAFSTSMPEQHESIQDRMSDFSLEHRRLADIAIHAFSALATGQVGVNGATGTLLLHTLREMRALSDGTLSVAASPQGDRATIAGDAG